MDWTTPSKSADAASCASNGQSKWFATLPQKSPLRKIVVNSAGDQPQDDKPPVFPIPPATPKRSQMMTSTHKFASTTEQPGPGDRSNLLNTVNNMVAQGLKNISTHEYEHDSRILRLQVYKDAFQHLINEFVLYKPFLSAVKNEYDSLISDFGDDLRIVSDLKVELRMKDQEFSAKMKVKDASFRGELVSRSTQILNLEKELRNKDLEIASVKTRFEQIDLKNAKLEKEINDLRKACEVLTNSLTRNEEEKRSYQSNDSGRQRELQAAKMAVQKANEELERIRNMLNDAESVQATLVGPEVVMKHVDTIKALKTSLAAKDAVHKRLIDRYSTLKSAVEVAFEEAEVNRSPAVKMDDKLEVEPVRPQAEVPRTRIAAELANPIKKWSKVKGVIAIQALINDRRTSPLQKPVLPKEILVANDLITADMAGEEHDTPMSAEELELMHEIEELGDLIDKSNDVGGSRKIIEVLISEVLKHKKRIQELTAELEQDDDEYDELGLLMKADGGTNSNGGGLADGKIESGWAHFEGLGLDESIPKYLRISGKIQNLFMTKRDTEQYVNEIWAAKEDYQKQLNLGVDDGVLVDGAGGELSQGNMHLSAFFEIFLEQRFKTQTRAVEFAYNFIDSLTKYSFDSDCKLFIMIMQGDLSEEIRHDQLNMLDDLLNELRHEDQLIHHKVDGRLTLDVFFRVIRRVFPTKGEHSIRRLEKALELEIKGRRLVLYEELLEEDEEGNQGKFCETLRMQHLTECSTFSRRVMDVISQYYDDSVAEATTTNAVEELALMTSQGPSLTVHELRNALSLADADKPRNEINKYLARGCNKSVQDVLLMETDRNCMIPVAMFKSNLKRGLIKKSKPSHESMMKNRVGKTSNADM